MWRLRETGDAVDTVIITPEPGRHKDIGQLLLSLAVSPHEVQWVTWPATGYSVPLELFQKFTEATAGTSEQNAPEAEAEPRKRRRRPRKEDSSSETSTDNDTSEEE